MARWAGALAPQVNLDPNPKNLPGSNVLQIFTNGVAGWCLLGCVLFIVVGGLLWAAGVRSQNYQHATDGKKTVAVSALAAVIIGGAASIINFFYGLGQKI
ncbi:MAG: DUF6112 family protein [Actinomycetota bacterium]|jgi:hypothetical protein|nr:DUF6112 family protein [Actinomycetota bacterium]